MSLIGLVGLIGLYRAHRVFWGFNYRLQGPPSPNKRVRMLGFSGLGYRV